MAVYFKLRCFEQQAAVKVLVVSNIIIACLGVVHWGYCGLMGKLISLYNDQQFFLSSQYDVIKALYQSPIAFYAIAGIQQILTSVAVILLALGYIGQTNHYMWTRVILGLLLINFGFNFVMAVWASMSCTFSNQLYKVYFDQWDFYYNSSMRDFVVVLRDFVNFSIAEAVLTFVVALPLIILTIIALLDYSLKEEIDQNPQSVINVQPKVVQGK